MRGKELELTICGYSKKGGGIAAYEGKVVEVRGSISGETLKAEVFGKRKANFLAKVTELFTPSSDRIESGCGHFPRCGGCAFQHMSYSAELTHKEKSVADLFPNIRPIIPAPAIERYRNKMEYTFSQSKEGKKWLGLIEAGSKGKVETLQSCTLTAPWFMQALMAVLRFWEESTLTAYRMLSGEGHLRNLILREGKNGKERMVILVVSGDPAYGLSKEHLREFVDALRFLEEDGARLHVFLKIHQAVKGEKTQFFEYHLHGSEWLEETLHITYPNGDIRTFLLGISPSAFFQPNTRQAEVLYGQALRLAEPKPTDVVYDLYCGTGTIGLTFAPLVSKVVGVEINPYAVYDALRNAELNGITNYEAHAGDMSGERAFSESADIVIVDPPRSGLEGKAIAHLCELAPKKVVYVSCNPQTQAEDVKKLIERGFIVEIVQPVDQFPRTPHVENIVLLKKGETQA